MKPRGSLALLALLTVASAVVAGTPVATVDDVQGRVVARLPGRATVQGLESGDVLEGAAHIVTRPDSSVRMLLHGGMAVRLGPDSSVHLVSGEPVLILDHGSVHVDHRPGASGGPPAEIRTKLAILKVPADGRAAISVGRSTGRIPASLRAAALHGDSVLAQPGGPRERALRQGHEVVGAGWIPAGRWRTSVLTPGQRIHLETHLLAPEEVAVTSVAPTPIPTESLALEGRPIPRETPVVLTQAQLPLTGWVTFTGRALASRVPGGIGPFYVAATRNGGVQWDRQLWTDPRGGFAYKFSPQDGVDYQVGFALVESTTGRHHHETPLAGLIYRQALKPTLGPVLLCGRAFPEAGDGPVNVYSDELVEFSLVLDAPITCDGPVSRLRLELSDDAGAHWRGATVRADRDPWSGRFRSRFAPLPGGTYRFRLRVTYSNPDERLKSDHRLAEWEAPRPVVYHDARTTERGQALVGELDRALAAGDASAVSQLLSPEFDRRGRDLTRAMGTRLEAGTATRRAGIVQVPVRWRRPAPDSDLGTSVTGTATFLFIKEADLRLLDVTGDDPFSPRAGQWEDEGSPGGPELMTARIDEGQAFDFDERSPHPYDPTRVPDDLALFQDEATGRLVLGTHDRRLARLGTGLLRKGRWPARPDRLEHRSMASLDEGATYLLRLSGGSDVAFEITKVSGASGRARASVALRWAAMR